jgi:curli biogenesis system outer membrane secretion channel CsgG
MKNSTFVKLLLVFCLGFSIAACGTTTSSGTYHQPYVDSTNIHARARYVAVLPFSNHTTYPNAGSIAGDLLATELYALSEFKIMERTRMMQVLKGDDEDITPVLDRIAALEAGKALGVDTVIFGSVTEYGYRRGLSEKPVVGVNALMLDVKTDTILWADAASFTSGGSLSGLARDVSHKLVQSMLAR